MTLDFVKPISDSDLKNYKIMFMLSYGTIWHNLLQQQRENNIGPTELWCSQLVTEQKEADKGMF